MSILNLDLGLRTEVITVERISRTWKEGAAGLPGMEIYDQKGRSHKLSSVDFHASEWEQITVGSRIEVTIKESDIELRLLSTRNVSVIIKAPTWGESEARDWSSFRQWIEKNGGVWVGGLGAHTVSFEVTVSFEAVE